LFSLPAWLLNVLRLSRRISLCQSNVKILSIQSNLVYISTNVGFLPDIITPFKREKVTFNKVLKQFNIIIQNYMYNFRWVVDKMYKYVLDAEKKLNEANWDIATAIFEWTKLCSFKKQRVEIINNDLLYELCTDLCSGCRSFIFYV